MPGYWAMNFFKSCFSLLLAFGFTSYKIFVPTKHTRTRVFHFYPYLNPSETPGESAFSYPCRPIWNQTYSTRVPCPRYARGSHILLHRIITSFTIIHTISVRCKSFFNFFWTGGTTFFVRLFICLFFSSFEQAGQPFLFTNRWTKRVVPPVQKKRRIPRKKNRPLS